MQGNFNVMTLNVRGLRNPVKRRGIFSFLKFSLCFLQKHSENSVMKLSEGVNGEVLSFCMNPIARNLGQNGGRACALSR